MTQNMYAHWLIMKVICGSNPDVDMDFEGIQYFNEFI